MIKCGGGHESLRERYGWKVYGSLRSFQFLLMIITLLETAASISSPRSFCNAMQCNGMESPVSPFRHGPWPSLIEAFIKPGSI